MSTAYTIGDQDFPRLITIPQLKANPLFNQAVAAYGRHVSGDRRKCCGGGKRTDAKEYTNIAGAALRRMASSDPKGLAAALRSAFPIPPNSQISLVIGGGLLLIP